MSEQTVRDAEIQGRLGKPGAGVPLPVKMMMRLYFKPFIMRRVKWSACESGLESSREKIRKEVLGLSREQLTRRVLVPPMTGLEDSSRYWSVAMVCRHLTIVGSRMAQVAVALSHGKQDLFKVDTALVKPESESNSVESVTEYFQFADHVVNKIRSEVGDRGSVATWYHPWFGQMRSKDWLWLIGGHQRLHLSQIRAIKKLQ
jgi:hypothetical protein